MRENNHRIQIGMLVLVCMMFIFTACGNGNDKNLPDGDYYAEVTLTGGTGKATIESPALVTVKDGEAYATLVWSSKYYDYMIVDGVKYINEAEVGEKSTFVVPVPGVSCEMTVIADTTAMSVPHEIEYELKLEKK